jgi:hypothetical protein
MKMHRAVPSALVPFLILTACGGPRPASVMANGEILPNRADPAIERARAGSTAEQMRLAEQRSSTGAAALASCAPVVCEAIARNELAIGMDETQVLAATRTTTDAWEIRPSGGVTLMTARSGVVGEPSDAVGKLAFIALQNGAVTSYTYREPTGFRTVATAADVTLAGRAAHHADALLALGDDFAAVGRLDLALDSYDRSDVIRPGHPETTLRIATTLDKQLRPIEAVLRYQLFLHQMELEKIAARGEAAARLAEAIALAQQRIIVLDRR